MKQPYTLLIVDDEPDLQELLADQLQDIASHFLFASDGNQAFELLRSNALEKPIDAVLSDINMPNLSGLELLRKVREAGMDTPFVFLTGYGDKEKVIAALRLGTQDFLEKPYKVPELIRSVKAALAHGVFLRNIDNQLDDAMQGISASKTKLQELRSIKRMLLLMNNNRRKAA